eukprot:5285311-Pleurochrysis_carterae.AAC.4
MVSAHPSGFSGSATTARCGCRWHTGSTLSRRARPKFSLACTCAHEEASAPVAVSEAPDLSGSDCARAAQSALRRVRACP